MGVAIMQHNLALEAQKSCFMLHNIFCLGTIRSSLLSGRCEISNTPGQFGIEVVENVRSTVLRSTFIGPGYFSLRRVSNE